MEVDDCVNLAELAGKTPVVEKVYHDDRDKLNSDLIDLDRCSHHHQGKSDLQAGNELKTARYFDEEQLNEFLTSSEGEATFKEVI